MERILDLGLSGNEYFGRVWTLAERMARSGRSERLHHWLPLEAWCGMVMHALLTTSENPKAASLYWDKLLPAAVCVCGASPLSLTGPQTLPYGLRGPETTTWTLVSPPDGVSTIRFRRQTT